MKELMLLLTILVIILVEAFVAVRALRVLIYRKVFPLDKQVQVKINREQMNIRYYQLSGDEVEILEKTANCVEIYITRKIKNELVLTVKDSSWTLFQDFKKDKISDKWVNYLCKCYFIEPRSRVKKIFSKLI